MVNTSVDTEKKILEAAKRVFLVKGLSGARMQEIADEAGINKSLLHYYFRSKQQLFKAIFEEIFSHFFPALISIFNNNEPLELKISMIVDQYIDEFGNKGYVPLFLINEIYQNPELVSSLSGKMDKMVHSEFMKELQEGIQSGKYVEVSPMQLLSNILSLCIFPILAQPMLKSVFQIGNEEYNKFLEERKKLIPEMILKNLIK